MSFISRKHNAYKNVLKQGDGQFLLASLLDFTGFYRQSFSENPYQTAFNEGKRAVALQIIQQLDMKEEELRELLRGYRSEMFQQDIG